MDTLAFDLSATVRCVRHPAVASPCMPSERSWTRVTKIIAGAGLTDRDRKSRWPARFDFAQSASGLLLVLFMRGHMFFVSSILISRDAMWTITKFSKVISCSAHRIRRSYRSSWRW